MVSAAIWVVSSEPIWLAVRDASCVVPSPASRGTKRGVRAQGIEYNPEMVKLSQDNAAKAGVSDKATFARADIFQRPFTLGRPTTFIGTHER